MLSTLPSPTITPIGHFGAGADEAIVLDDGGAAWQRLQHPAQSGAAGNMAMRADLGAGTHRGPGIDHVDSPTRARH